MMEFSIWANQFWRHVGERAYVLTPDAKWGIKHPMIHLFRKNRWLPIRDDMFNRMRNFINTDEKLRRADMNYVELADLACKNLRNDLLGDQRVVLATRSLKEDIGVMPRVDNVARRRWLRRRDELMEKINPYVEVMSEYLLRHVVKAEEFPLEFRHGVLENFGRELFRKYWKAVSGNDNYSSAEKSIYCTLEDWDNYVKVNLLEYIKNAALVMKKICTFTEYDFSAIKNLIGKEYSTLCNLLEAQSATKIKTQLELAIARYQSFKTIVARSVELGAMRECDLEFNCRILMYRIKVHFTDVGRGVVLKEKITDGMFKAAGVGLGAAMLAFPPLFALGALGMAIFGSLQEPTRKRKRK